MFLCIILLLMLTLIVFLGLYLPSSRPLPCKVSVFLLSFLFDKYVVLVSFGQVIK